METEKKLDTIEEELKLMKGELKQTLASVRDYLLNMELPSTEFSTMLAALGDSEQNVTMKGTFSLPPEGGPGGEVEEESSKSEAEHSSNEDEPTDSHDNAEDESELTPAEDELTGSHENVETETESPPEDEPANQDENPESEDVLPAQEEVGEPLEQDEPPTPEPEELSVEEEQLMEYEKLDNEISKSIPKVNLLANLINWIAKAKKEIGDEQLPTFLEVYGISGHLSPELKEIIMNLSEIASEQVEDADKAEIWSQSMLSLHGILTGGDAPLYPVKPSWHEVSSEIEPGEEEIIEVDKSKETPVKLKLVFPNGEGKSKEYCIDLAPEEEKNGS